MFSSNEIAKMASAAMMIGFFAVFGMGAGAVLGVYGLYRLYLYLSAHIQWVP